LNLEATTLTTPAGHHFIAAQAGLVAGDDATRRGHRCHGIVHTHRVVVGDRPAAYPGARGVAGGVAQGGSTHRRGWDGGLAAGLQVDGVRADGRRV